MKIHTMLAMLLALSAETARASEYFRCDLVSEVNGRYQKDDEQYVEMTLNQEAVRSRIYINAATKVMTFATCSSTRNDGSNFKTWFDLECRDFASLDGSPYTIEVFLAGAYAGISPPIKPDYSMYATLSAIGKKLGIGTPLRTFVIYSNHKPQYEFFCYQ
jgi:hypothetical protein